MKKILIVFLSLFLIFSAVSCENGVPAETQQSTEAPHETVAETEPPAQLTYSGVEVPTVKIGGQYLQAEPVDEAEEGKIIYSVNNEKAGTIIGATEQNINGQSFTVRAEANIGYKFVGWSDGKTDPVRSGDTEEGVYTAIFDYDILDLPIVVIKTDGGRSIKSKNRYIPATISILGCDEEFVLESVPMEIRGRGNATWGFDKKSYKFKLTEKENLFGMANGKERIWVLLANHCDQSLLRNHISMELGRTFDAIAWEPASIPVDVYLNGEYLGAYLLAEEIKISGDRINVTDTTPDEVDTGYMLEMTNYADRNDIKITVAKKEYVVHNDLSSDPNIYNAQIKFISEYIDAAYQSLKNGDYEAANELINLDSLVAAYILQETVKNYDSHWDNFYMWKDAGGKLNFGPFWDFDIALANTWEEATSHKDLYAGNGKGSAKGLNNWFPMALQNEWFRQMVADEWNEMYPELMLFPSYVIEEAERHKASYERNFEKWQIFGQRINLEPETIMALSSYTEHYTYLSEWLERRVEWLNEAFNHEGFVSDGEGLERVRKR